MSETVKYVANGGQTYLPCQDNVNVPFEHTRNRKNQTHYCRNWN